jgi:16S rRNA (guanine(1405)-N(7))-methyltransferase
MLQKPDQPAIEALVNDVLTSNKYRDVSPDLIRNIAGQEMGRRRSSKETLKAIKNKLHQVGGAYLDGREDITQWLGMLQAATETDDQNTLKQTCQNIMSHHASTRERLPILTQFYTTLLADLPPIQSVLDIACGLNPLARPWMGLDANVEYYAYDIYQQMINFLNEYMKITHLKGYAQTCDVIQHCPTQPVDLAFVLKVLPCLEQVDKQASYQLLRTLNARHMVVSFPIQSLGGKHKGMVTHYETHFRELIVDEPWEVQRYEFSTELVFVIKK